MTVINNIDNGSAKHVTLTNSPWYPGGITCVTPLVQHMCSSNLAKHVESCDDPWHDEQRAQQMRPYYISSSWQVMPPTITITIVTTITTITTSTTITTITTSSTTTTITTSTSTTIISWLGPACFIGPADCNRFSCNRIFFNSHTYIYIYTYTGIILSYIYIYVYIYIYIFVCIQWIW